MFTGRLASRCSRCAAMRPASSVRCTVLRSFTITASGVYTMLRDMTRFLSYQATGTVVRLRLISLSAREFAASCSAFRTRSWSRTLAYVATGSAAKAIRRIYQAPREYVAICTAVLASRSLRAIVILYTATVAYTLQVGNVFQVANRMWTATLRSRTWVAETFRKIGGTAAVYRSRTWVAGSATTKTWRG